MIKNEVQYKLTKTSVEGFEKRLNWLRANPEARGDVDPIVARAEEDALESMIEELNEELQDYNRTKAGHVDMEVLYSVGKISGALISARIAKGLTHRQLASMVGLKEQQIQRYEARDYANVDLSRVQEIARALIAEAAEAAATQSLG
jgi:HTH-type transcriptional regulator/antitoxin HigA